MFTTKAVFGAAAALMAPAVMARCPASYDFEAPTAWGAATATDGDFKLYEPKGLSVLGKRVSYVLAGDSSESALYFRLKDQAITDREPFPRDLQSAFVRDHAQSGASCDEGGCSAEAASSSDDGLRRVELTADRPRWAEWTGPGARLIDAERKLGGASGLYLKCTYR